jgi:hypothetical protein
VVAVGLVVVAAGLALAGFPHADHVWLDALEGGFPALQRPFLSAFERRVAADARESIARDARELSRLRALATDVQWERRNLPPEQRERLRQFVVGREELLTGDAMVLKTLSGRVRERQRLTLGLPLALAGGALVLAALRLGRAARPLS